MTEYHLEFYLDGVWYETAGSLFNEKDARLCFEQTVAQSNMAWRLVKIEPVRTVIAKSEKKKVKVVEK